MPSSGTRSVCRSPCPIRRRRRTTRSPARSTGATAARRPTSPADRSMTARLHGCRELHHHHQRQRRRWGHGHRDAGRLVALQPDRFLSRSTRTERATFKLGSTIPVKIKVTDCNGTSVGTLVPQVSLRRVGSGLRHGERGRSSSRAFPTVDDDMRYDASGQQYIYNLRPRRASSRPRATGRSLSVDTSRRCRTRRSRLSSSSSTSSSRRTRPRCEVRGAARRPSLVQTTGSGATAGGRRNEMTSAGATTATVAPTASATAPHSEYARPPMRASAAAIRPATRSVNPTRP